MSQIPVQTDVPGRPGVTRQQLYQDAETGSKTRLLTFPPGYRSQLSLENDGMMESHASSEEIFVLDGVMSFGRWYDIPSLGYTFHPPGWIHPADQQSAVGWRMLIKSGAQADFTLTAPPADWNGAEFSLLDPQDTSGVTRTHVPSVTKQELVLPDGTRTGLFAQTLLSGGPDGWSTWMLTVPGGWRGEVRAFEFELAGLEFFVLSGDLTSRIDGKLVELTAGNYYCEPGKIAVQSRSAFSRDGCYAICWTRS